LRRSILRTRKACTKSNDLYWLGNYRHDSNPC
jgi:hypothetical protein